MLTLPPTVRIFLAVGVTDMRKSFDGLAEATRSVLGKDPLSGHLFVFSNRRRDRVKLLLWDRSGFWVLAKRLEQGTFAWPKMVAGHPPGLEMRSEDLAMLLGGIDFRSAKRRRWYDRPIQASTSV